MRITYRASGGFGGLIHEADVNVDRLDDSEARHVCRLLALAQAVAPAELDPRARDAGRIDITVHGSAAQASARMCFAAQAVPDAARDLIAYLKERAQPSRPG